MFPCFPFIFHRFYAIFSKFRYCPPPPQSFATLPTSFQICLDVHVRGQHQTFTARIFQGGVFDPTLFFTHKKFKFHEGLTVIFAIQEVVTGSLEGFTLIPAPTYVHVLSVLTLGVNLNSAIFVQLRFLSGAAVGSSRYSHPRVVQRYIRQYQYETG